MKELRYKKVYHYLKEGIQKGDFPIGTKLPSEHAMCKQFSVTRTTVRSALAELDREGFIQRGRGRQPLVLERNHSLGLLNVKGLSETAGTEVRTQMLQAVSPSVWPEALSRLIRREEKQKACFGFERIRLIRELPFMYESSWFSSKGLEDFAGQEFTGGSFFRTLRQRYFIEITGSEQELHAMAAGKEVAGWLQVPRGHPILRIHIRFSTSKAGFHIYSLLYCNTDHYAIGNRYIP